MATTSETTQDDSPMRLSVTNFGPIAEAQIELRPLTVFVGPSNTGKSYLASLILALHNSFGAKENYLSFFSSIPGETQSYSDRLTERQVKYFHNWIHNEFNSDLTKQNNGQSIEPNIPKPIIQLFKNFLEFKYTANHSITSEISRCFGIENVSSLIRNTGQDATLSLELVKNFKHSNSSFVIDLEVTRENEDFSISIPQNIVNCLDIAGYFTSLMQRNIYFSNLNRSVLPEKLLSEFRLALIAEPILNFAINPLSETGYYLPADRTGVMHAHQVVTTSLIRSSSTAVFRSFPNIPTLSGVLGDFLEQLVKLAQVSENGGDYATSAKKMEKDLLNGKIYSSGEHSKEIPYPAFSYQPYGWEKRLPLMNASSMVSELAPIVLYLRHIIEQGDVLIIEEPESHLHPAKQVEFMRQLALLIKEGLRIIITTHSEWILEALGNIVQISKLPEEERNGLPSEDFALERDQVGVWLFKPKKRPKGSVVKEIEINSDSGNFPVDYGEVMEALYDEWVSTFNRLENIRVN